MRKIIKKFYYSKYFVPVTFVILMIYSALCFYGLYLLFKNTKF